MNEPIEHNYCYICGEDAREPDADTCWNCYNAQKEREERERKGPFVVAVYLVDRAYGGSEEGGWWYDTADLVRVMKVFKNRNHAAQYSERLRDRLDRTLNACRRSDISSVLSEGRYDAYIELGNAPKHHPTKRPHYE